MGDPVPFPEFADAETVSAQLTHIIEDLHDLSRRFAAIEAKAESWEARAEPLLKLRDSARRMTQLGRGRA